jgi:pimeloyl-ACP methyl ester carboxylesterase
MPRAPVFTLLLSWLTAAAAPAADSRPLPCTVPGVGSGALCATLSVWENRETQSGRRIPLNLVILPALDRHHAPDPLFLLDGGPGAGATELAPGFARSVVRERRDIVMIDQRGTGRSHPLECDFFGHPPDLERLVAGQFPVEQVRVCRERLSQIADLRQYTTAIAMDDVDEVRQWLGYQKIDLWGGSYGSLAAQVYLRRHEANVRAVVLQGVLPADELAVLHHAWAGQRAIELLFERCREDSACRGEYPRLREDFQAMFERVRAGAEVQVHDREGRTARVRPGVEAVAEGIRHRLYSDTGMALAGMIHRGAAGDLAPVVQAAIDANLALDARLAMGLLLSVSCAEHIPYITAELAARETAGTFLGDLRIREQQAACAEWPRGEVPQDVHAPVRSNVPVLLMSGYLDSVTPPEFAERVAQGLPNSLHVVFPHDSHAGVGRCSLEMMADFLNRGSVKGLDTSCVQPKPRLPVAGGALAIVIGGAAFLLRLKSRG